MKRGFWFQHAMSELTLLAERSPVTSTLRDLLLEADFYQTQQGTFNKVVRASLKCPVLAATDPWAEVEYQSLYLIDSDPENRVVLQEPSVKDPMVGVMVLKAARLRGESGMVYCGTPEQLKAFASKLSGFEKISDEENMDEKEFLECLVDAAEADGLKVIYYRLSVEHGGEDNEDE